jgi:hypothetical protein
MAALGVHEDILNLRDETLSIRAWQLHMVKHQDLYHSVCSQKNPIYHFLEWSPGINKTYS